MTILKTAARETSEQEENIFSSAMNMGKTDA